MMKRSIVIALAACAACSRPDGTARTARSAPTKPAEAHAADSAAAHNSPLDGTHWRLVQIQSMDDRQGTTRPDDPSKYTLGFEKALVSMRLPISSFVGVRPSSFSNSRDARTNLVRRSFMWTGIRIVRD